MKSIFLSLALLFSVSMVQAQGPDANNTSSNLQNQFNKLKSNSNSYNEGRKSYKVIELGDLNAFWSSVQQGIRAQEKSFIDAGKATEAELAEAKETIALQASHIDSLKKDNAIKEQAAQQNAYEVENIVVLGIGINKEAYVYLTFGIILLLIGASAVVAYMYKNSKVVTDEKIHAYREIENEFTEYKKAARERELRIKRDLQTELNSKAELLEELAALKPHSNY